jgi:DNA-binding transcriptional LysR family regulator
MASLPIVVTPPQTSLHDMVVDWFRNGNCSIDKLNVCNSVSFMVQLVAAGHAVALLPRSIVQAQVDAGMIRPLQVTPAISLRTYYVSYLREQPGLADGMLTRLAREVFMQSGLLQAR